MNLNENERSFVELAAKLFEEAFGSILNDFTKDSKVKEDSKPIDAGKSTKESKPDVAQEKEDITQKDIDVLKLVTDIVETADKILVRITGVGPSKIDDDDPKSYTIQDPEDRCIKWNSETGYPFYKADHKYVHTINQAASDKLEALEKKDDKTKLVCCDVWAGISKGTTMDDTFAIYDKDVQPETIIAMLLSALAYASFEYMVDGDQKNDTEFREQYIKEIRSAYYDCMVALGVKQIIKE